MVNGYVKDKGVFFKSNNELPNSNVSVKEDTFVSINLQLIFLRVLRRVILLSSNKGQWKKFFTPVIAKRALYRTDSSFW